MSEADVLHSDPDLLEGHDLVLVRGPVLVTLWVFISKTLLSMMMARQPCSQTMLQKCGEVEDSGPWVSTYDRPRDSRLRRLALM